MKSIATITVENAPTTVRHNDGDKAITIKGTPVPDSDLTKVGNDFNAAIDSIQLPEGLSLDTGGALEEQQKANRQLVLAMLVAIVLVFIIMVATFKSLWQPLILLVAIPFAATGALLGLLVTGDPLGVPAMIGLLMLIGIVVTNAIVLIDLINSYRERGEDSLTAIVDGARLRLRPIIMTAAATVFALLPMGLGLTGGGHVHLASAGGGGHRRSGVLHPADPAARAGPLRPGHPLDRQARPEPVAARAAHPASLCLHRWHPLKPAARVGSGRRT